MDDLVRQDIKLLRQAGKTVLEDFFQRIEHLKNKPKSFKSLQPPLKGFRKVKFSKQYRIVYSLDEAQRQVLILGVGTRQEIYERLAVRSEQKISTP